MGIKEYCESIYSKMFRKPKGDFKHPCFMPIDIYAKQLWDWGSYFSNVALRQISTNLNKQDELFEYEKGCILNFLDFQKDDGSIPICIANDKSGDLNKDYPNAKNVHKPCLAQHAAFICKYNSDFDWLKDCYDKIKNFVLYYIKNAKHSSGLFYFFDDFAIGIDNEPTVFYRPDNSTASIYLNSLILKELEAMIYLSDIVCNSEDKKYFEAEYDDLKKAIIDNCYDEKDGMFYSCDINLRPLDKDNMLHSCAPRHYDNLIMRIGTVSSFFPLWAKIATKVQADRMVKENLLDENSFWAPFGVRTLSKYEKMYRPTHGSSNPSNWHGGIWVISNYIVFKGLLNYGFMKEAKELARKTVKLLENDYEKNKCFHEYYDPETGNPIWDPNFLSWDLLVINMKNFLDGSSFIEEF